MDNLDKLPEILNNILEKVSEQKSKASADWKNYETACEWCATEEPKIPDPKFKIWAEVVFEFEDSKYPIYLKITSMTYCEKLWTWVYNPQYWTNKACKEQDLRHATIPEVIQHFRP